MKNLPKLIVILGPTASGKTELAVELASKLNGEIVSADSRQIYKKMNIGTGKPTKKEMKGIPHHLLDIVSPNQEFNVAVYREKAAKKIKEIQKKGKLPFLVGGTGLYIKSITENIDFPKVPPNEKLRKILEKKTKEQLINTYKKLDPQGVKFIEKENKRRLIRAIEVCKATSKPFWKQRKRKEPIFDVLKIGLKPEKKELEKRINKRVERMLKQGLEKETKNLSEKYGWIPLMETIGYQEWKDYFGGEIRKEEVKKLIKLHTIQFAKRQLTWFKKEKGIHWLKDKKEAERLIRKFIK